MRLMNTYKLVPYQDKSGKWRFRFVCKQNGEIMASSAEGDGFSSRSNAVRAARRLRMVAWMATLEKE